MQNRTTIRSWRAMALAGLFLAGTSYVLFQDLIQGAPLSTSHVLTMLALVAATAAGHACVPVGREHRYVLALGLAVVALGGLGYIVTMSGARNAETIAKKAGSVTQNNADRTKLEAEIADTRRDLKDQRQALAKECASGKGNKCDGWVTTADRTLSHLSLLEVRLEKLNPAEVENAGYKHLAKLWTVALGGEVKAIEEAFVLYMPFVAVLITELGTIVFLSLGLGHGMVPVTANDNRPAMRPAPAPKKRRRKRDAKVISWVAEFRRKHGRDPQIPEVRAQFPVSKSTAQRYRKTA